MREFASARVAEVEAHFGVRRASWPECTNESLADHTRVRFFLEGPETAGTFLYHAMIDLGGGSMSEPVFFGHPRDIPLAWLDAPSIRTFFGATVEEFAASDFLDKYFER